MLKKLHERRVPHGDTQRAVLRFLRDHGPKQRWEIQAAIGRKCSNTICRLLKSGHIEQYDDANMHPNPCNKVEHLMANYVAFVRDLDAPQRKGISPTSLKWAEKVLRSAGYTVSPPDSNPHP